MACGLALIRRSPVGGQRARARRRAAPARRTAPRGGSSAATSSSSCAVVGVRRGPRPAGPGARATCPRPARRRPPSGRSSPSACAARSSASAGGAGCTAVRPRAAGLDRRDLVERRRQRRRPCSWCIDGRVVALDDERPVAVALEERAQLVRRDAGEDRRVGDLVAVEVEDRQDGAVASPGSRNLLECQLAASGPVSASPSPTTQQTTQVRVVERRAVGVRRARSPSSPPSWIEPGVSGATWLGMPPGNENWRNSRRRPASSRADRRVDLACTCPRGRRSRRGPGRRGRGRRCRSRRGRAPG